ncbi:hypothetical protein CEXT_83371 [Caerostris extrusa]|uniref:Uncharacterized protein n=1 Tax=Caerostris extrusa TaxID=172846 RepID=A0AAV4MP05_CAEEX|nr:hypothetical protein CEXT_83371 [Caerostris extrusa]
MIHFPSIYLQPITYLFEQILSYLFAIAGPFKWAGSTRRGKLSALSTHAIVWGEEEGRRGGEMKPQENRPRKYERYLFPSTKYLARHACQGILRDDS